METDVPKRFFPPEPWSVTERAYRPELNEFLETIFFLGNGYMGVRGTPEEGFAAGEGAGSFPATYVASVYDLVPQRGGHHVPYVSQCSVMAAGPDWFGVELTLGGSRFDPRAGRVLSYRRRLDMRTGTLVRHLVWADRRGRRTELEFVRFVSLADRHVAAVRVAIRPLNWSGRVRAACGLDASRASRQRVVRLAAAGPDGALLATETLVTRFRTAAAMRLRLEEAGRTLPAAGRLVRGERCVARVVSLDARAGRTYRLEKLLAVTTSRDASAGPPGRRAASIAAACRRAGFDALLAAHAAAWSRLWARADVTIDGDRSAQQAARFCVFNMHQDYAGDDERVNIPAKGLSGPGYGGLYWWDTEAYMLPFFLYTVPEAARALVRYRCRTIDGARKKARLFGYDGAMYPWVTIYGEECSGDWEYGMLEQHVTSAVAHGVWHYLQATGDEELLWDGGGEVLVETARFWTSRAHYSPRRRAYVIQYVTGPDEYAVGVNNNFYTNFMAAWNLRYALEALRRMRRQPARWRAFARRLRLRDGEPARWRDVARRMYLPRDRRLGIPEQDDAFLDREPFDMRTHDPADLPAGRWLWERLQRSQAMKQPDVLMAMYLRDDCFPPAEQLAAYRFYEPKTTHESSLSRCVHAIVAGRLGLEDEALAYYLSSARLDLDDVNGNAHQGHHAACVAGSYLSLVMGFGGMCLRRGGLAFRPRLPRRWKSLSFPVAFRGRAIRVKLTRGRVAFALRGRTLAVTVNGRKVALRDGETTEVRV